MTRRAFLKPRLVPEPDRRGYQGVRERALMVEVWQYVKHQDALSQAAAVLALEAAGLLSHDYSVVSKRHLGVCRACAAVRWAKEVLDGR